MGTKPNHQVPQFKSLQTEMEFLKAAKIFKVFVLMTK